MHKKLKGMRKQPMSGQFTIVNECHYFKGGACVPPYILLDIIVWPTIRFKKRKAIAYMLLMHIKHSTLLVFNYCDL